MKRQSFESHCGHERTSTTSTRRPGEIRVGLLCHTASTGYELESRIAEQRKEEGGPTTGERKWNVLQMELPKKVLTETILAVGGKDVKAAN